MNFQFFAKNNETLSKCDKLSNFDKNDDFLNFDRKWWYLNCFGPNIKRKCYNAYFWIEFTKQEQYKSNKLFSRFYLDTTLINFQKCDISNILIYIIYLWQPTELEKANFSFLAINLSQKFWCSSFYFLKTLKYVMNIKIRT